jgi:hypothetical protein
VGDLLRMMYVHDSVSSRDASLRYVYRYKYGSE